MSIYQRLLLTFCIFVGVVLVGGIGFKLMSGRQHSFIECAYNAFVFISTVDRPFDGALEESCGLGYRVFTVFLVISGMGTILYGVSTITALIVEGELTDALRRRRMENKIRKLSSHYILCGAGETGFYIAEELYKIGAPFVIVENSRQQLDRLKDFSNMLYVEGDATDDNVLKKAGIESAAGIIMALHSDQENLFVTLSARQLNPKIKIVAKCIDPGNDKKLLRAGASEVVSPSAIGGLRMVSVMVRPTVVTFLDKMLRDPEETTRIEEMTVSEGSDIADKTLAEAQLSKQALVLVLAVKPSDKDRFNYRPTSDTRLTPGTIVVVMGEVKAVNRAREMAGMTVKPDLGSDNQ